MQKIFSGQLVQLVLSLSAAIAGASTGPYSRSTASVLVSNISSTWASATSLGEIVSLEPIVILHWEVFF